MSAIQGARQRARAEITAEITATARRHLANEGAAGLSLRAVARDLGMVSSAVYRYFANRDELLTALIIEAYEAVGQAAEDAARASSDQLPATRFVAVASGIRTWAGHHEHEYALVYGSPVPGYAAPTDTVAPAARVSLALAGVVVDAHAAGLLQPPPGPPLTLSRSLRDDLVAVRREIAPDLDDEVVARLIVAWSQVFGLISFELFGQTAGLISAHDDLFAASAEAMARYVGLP